eukprot:5371575-Prymnesium_polylepis.2
MHRALVARGCTNEHATNDETERRGRSCSRHENEPCYLQACACSIRCCRGRICRSGTERPVTGPARAPAVADNKTEARRSGPTNRQSPRRAEPLGPAASPRATPVLPTRP